ncbi:hypothetical protein LEJ84_20225 [Salmonella enterica]|nr:hypothetical protein [Salmonella enterica subsp. enterica serovar Virchow]MDJ7811468.1 hypothetical protein [Salmonella enterica]
MENQALSEELDYLFSVLVREKELKPPYTIRTDIIKDFSDRCEVYLDILQTYIDEHKNSLSRRLSRRFDRIIDVCDGINDSLSDFLSGDIKGAYDAFNSTFSEKIIATYIQDISIPLNHICNEEKPLFRVRKSDTAIKERNEMFHIPFSKRHFVNAQRYSVAGLPCLYLGTSLYICWQEMDKPDFDKLYISAFSSDDSESKILNFSAKILYNGNYLSIGDNSLSIDAKLAYLCLMPLIFACNYKKIHDNVSFTQEYIIPNLLMQWISRRSKSNVVGIAYRSTKMIKSSYNDKSINVVLPPKVTYKQTIEQDFCPKLLKMFRLTSPVSWQVLKTLDYTYEITENSEERRASRYLRRKEKLAGIQDFDEDLISLYPLTDFYKLEKCIDNLLRYGAIIDKNGDTLAAEH